MTHKAARFHCLVRNLGQLPEVWLEDAGRLDQTGVPEEDRRPLTKGQTALELLDQVRAGGLPGRLVVADAVQGVSGPFREALAPRGPRDAGQGVSGPFREALASRGLHYIVGVTDEMVVFTEEPGWEVPGPAARPSKSGVRPRQRPRLKDGILRPVSLKALAASTEADLT